MATPVGHSLAGLAVSRFAPSTTPRQGWGFTFLCIFMANLPDLDFFPGLLVGRPALYHQGITHSLFAAVVASAVATMIFRTEGRATVFAVCLAAYATHLLLDLFGPDARYPYGIPLLWPLSDRAFLAPVQILMGVHHSGATSEPTSTWLRNLLHVRNVLAIALEIAVVAPLLLAAELVARRRRRSGT